MQRPGDAGADRCTGCRVWCCYWFIRCSVSCCLAHIPRLRGPPARELRLKLRTPSDIQAFARRLAPGEAGLGTKVLCLAALGRLETPGDDDDPRGDLEGNIVIRIAIQNLVPPRLPEVNHEELCEGSNDDDPGGRTGNNQTREFNDSDLLDYFDWKLESERCLGNKGSCRCFAPSHLGLAVFEYSVL